MRGTLHRSRPDVTMRARYCPARTAVNAGLSIQRLPRDTGMSDQAPGASRIIPRGGRRHGLRRVRVPDGALDSTRCGVARAVFELPAAPRDEVLPRLDAYAAAMRSVGAEAADTTCDTYGAGGAT